MVCTYVGGKGGEREGGGRRVERRERRERRTKCQQK